MGRKLPPRIVSVTGETKPLTLRIVWDNGAEGVVDLSGFLETFRVFEPLARRPDLFRTVQRGEYGTDVFWDEELDMAADTLWRLAGEQSGETMTADGFRNWRERKAYRPRRSGSRAGNWSPTSAARRPFHARCCSPRRRWNSGMCKKVFASFAPG
jgi:hypothetical protein